MSRSVKLIVLLVALSLVAGLVAYAATAQSAASDVVYVTNTGTKYHKSTCRYLSKSKIKTTRGQAEKDGYTACKVCKP